MKNIVWLLTSPEDEGKENVRINLSLVHGLIGFSCAFCYFFLLYGGSVLLPSSLFTPVQSILCRIALLMSGAVCIFCWRALHAILSRKTMGILYRISMVFALMPPFTYLLVQEAGFSNIVFLLWALSGLPCAFLYIEWTPSLCSVIRGNTIAFVALSSLMSGVLFLLIEALAQPIALAFCIVLPFMAFFLNITLKQNERPIPEKKSTGKKHHARQAWDAILYTLVQCLGLGFGIYCLLHFSRQTDLPVGSYVYGIALSAACLVLIVDWKNHRILDEERATRYLNLVIAIPILALVFFREPFLFLIVGGFLVFSMWIAALIGCSSEAESAKAGNLAPKPALARGWGFSLLGMAIGYSLGYLGIDRAGSYPMMLALLVSIIFVVILAIVTVSSTPRHARRHFLETSANMATHKKKSGDIIDASDTTRKQGPFREKCNRIADIHGLSMRQREVFMLLARGRDSKYIQGALVISQGTADSHIYNIYKKLNVHSRQELLDMIENYKEKR